MPKVSMIYLIKQNMSLVLVSMFSGWLESCFALMNIVIELPLVFISDLKREIFYLTKITILQVFLRVISTEASSDLTVTMITAPSRRQ